MEGRWERPHFLSSLFLFGAFCWVRVLSSLRVSILRQENEKIRSGRAEGMTITIQEWRNT